MALDTIADVDASGLWPGKVVTEVAPAGPFWEAEPEHQDYLRALSRTDTPAISSGPAGNFPSALPPGDGRPFNVRALIRFVLQP